jgi:phosphoglucan,water dikinase
MSSPPLLFISFAHYLTRLCQGGSAFLSKAEDAAWAKPLGAALLGVRHMGLSGWQPAECMALENELAEWQEHGGLIENLQARRCADTTAFPY